MKNLFLILIGISGGITVGSAIAAFFTLLKFVPRVVQITETNEHIVVYEYAMLLGAVTGSLLFYIDFNLSLSPLPVILIGGLCGIFLGLFTSALAEVLNVIPVFAKKFKLKGELLYIIIALILGKVAGSLFFFLIFLKK